MRCQKCGGLMAYERYFDAFEEFYAWRCVSCGDIVDPIILKNRGKKRA